MRLKRINVEQNEIYSFKFEWEIPKYLDFLINVKKLSASNKSTYSAAQTASQNFFAVSKYALKLVFIQRILSQMYALQSFLTMFETFFFN